MSTHGDQNPQRDPLTRASRPLADLPLSILDLAQVGRGQRVGDAIRTSVERAQNAEQTERFTRI